MRNLEPVRALFDVNVLIALSDQDHVHHDLAHAWWKANDSSGWATCPLTQNGFVRISSQPKYPNAISTADAVRRLRQTLTRGVHQFWPDDVSLVDEAVCRSDDLISARQVTDVYLLSLSVRHGGRLVTFDGNIPLAAVLGATPSHLVVLGG